jgi:hypothetical protein
VDRVVHLLGSLGISNSSGWAGEMERVDLPQGYKLEEVGHSQLLKRPNGYVLAVFGEGVKPENIRRVAEADEEYLRAVKLQDKFGVLADPETVLLFSEDVRESPHKVSPSTGVSLPG